MPCRADGIKAKKSQRVGDELKSESHSSAATPIGTRVSGQLTPETVKTHSKGGNGKDTSPKGTSSGASYTQGAVVPQEDFPLKGDRDLRGVPLFHFYFNRALTIQSQATMDLTCGMSFSRASKPV